MSKGQVALFTIGIAVLVFIVVVVFTQPLKQMTEEARDSSHMDCANTSISTGTKLACIVTDLYTFGFIAAVLGAGISYISLRNSGVA